MSEGPRNEHRRISDEQVWRMLGKIERWMEEYERDQKDTREWRTSSERRTEELEKAIQTTKDQLKTDIAGLSQRLSNLTAPARWGLGIATIVTTVGGILAFGKQFVLWFVSIVKS